MYNYYSKSVSYLDIQRSLSFILNNSSPFLYRIIPVSRPILLEDLERKIQNSYGHKLTMSYMNNDITIPITKQLDLDNAVALLDFSPQLTSLRIYLSNGVGACPNTVDKENSFTRNHLNNNNRLLREKHSWVQ